MKISFYEKYFLITHFEIFELKSHFFKMPYKNQNQYKNENYED